VKLKKIAILVPGSLMLMLSSCCSVPEMGYGVSRDEKGTLVIEVPSPQAETVEKALSLTCEPSFTIRLLAGKFQASEDDVEEIKERSVSLKGKSWEQTTLWVPEFMDDDIRNRCRDMRVCETREYRSAFVKFWCDLGEGLWGFFRFLFTGR
jgi:hypothetical protein